MSALGDIQLSTHANKTAPGFAKIHKVFIPHCILFALDDPVVSWRVMAANHGLMHPSKIVQTGVGNIMLMLTKQGGHLGWPVGMSPAENGWKWMSQAANSYASAVVRAKASIASETI
jgi:predicted alpha/beta-fold hydrolase